MIHSLCEVKLPPGLQELPYKNRVKIGVIAGRTGLSKQEWQDFGITVAISVTEETIDLDYAIAHARSLLADTTSKFALTNLG